MTDIEKKVYIFSCDGDVEIDSIDEFYEFVDELNKNYKKNGLDKPYVIDEDNERTIQAFILLKMGLTMTVRRADAIRI